MKEFVCWSRESEGASDVGVLAAGRWFDCDPEERDCDGNKAGPNVDDGGCSSSSSHKPFCKRVKMSQHPEAEEHPSKEPAPLWDGAVDGSAKSNCDGDQVNHDNHKRWGHEGCPFDDVEVSKVIVIVIPS